MLSSQDRGQEIGEPILVATEFLCDDPDCKALVLLHTTRAANETRKDVLERLGKSVFHVRCMNTHYSLFPSDPKSIVRCEDEGPFTPFLGARRQKSVKYISAQVSATVTYT